MDVKDLYTKIFLKSSGNEVNEEKIKVYKSEWWFNQRSKKVGGLRLTDLGINFIIENAKIKIYEVDLPEEVKQVPQLLIWLDKFITSPYYIDKKKIIVTDEKLAFELYLFSGDVRKMGFIKAMRSRNPELYN
jgi:hypothetical protein